MAKTEADKKKLIALLQRAPIIEAAVKRAGISRATYYRWRERDPDFVKAADAALSISRSTINDLAESYLIAQIKDNTLPAITFWLKHNHPKYGNKLELSGKVSTQNETLTSEQENMVKQALINAGLITNDKESK